MQVPAPCKDCPRRRRAPEPDCHNRDYCPEWGVYEDRCKEALKREHDWCNVVGVEAERGLKVKHAWIRSHKRK